MHIFKKYTLISDVFKNGIENNKEPTHKMYLIVKIRNLFPRAYNQIYLNYHTQYLQYTAQMD